MLSIPHDSFIYNVQQQIAVISENGSYSKELNLISYRGQPPKFDLRTWKTQQDGRRQMFKGITLTAAELIELRDVLDAMIINGRENE